MAKKTTTNKTTTTPSGQSFSYVDKSGAVKSFSAADSASALANRPSDANPTSGVMQNTAPTTPTTTTKTDGTTTSTDGSTTGTKIRRTVKTGSEVTETDESVRRSVEKTFDDRRATLLAAITAQTQAKEQGIKKTGEENLASQRSINLRAGLGGSDFGAAAKAETKADTQAKLDLLETERLAKVEAAITGLETLQQAKLDAEYARLDRKSEEYTKKRDQMAEEAQKQITSLGQAGYSLADIKTKDPELYQSILDSTEKGDLEVEAMLNNAKDAANKIDYQYKTVGNKVIAYGVDKRTGKIVSMEQDVGVNFDEKTGGGYGVSFAPDGTMLLIPKNFSGNPSEIIVGGGFGKNDVSQTRTKANQYLQGKIGSDGKVSPETFKAARNAWIQDGFAGDDFNKEFSSYINFSNVDDYGVPLSLLSN